MPEASLVLYESFISLYALQSLPGGSRAYQHAQQRRGTQARLSDSKAYSTPLLRSRL